MGRGAYTREGGGEARAGREGTTRRGRASGVGPLWIDPGAIEKSGIERVEILVGGQEVGPRGDSGRRDPDVVLLGRFTGPDEIGVELGVELKNLIRDVYYHTILEQLF